MKQRPLRVDFMTMERVSNKKCTGGLKVQKIRLVNIRGRNRKSRVSHDMWSYNIKRSKMWSYFGYIFVHYNQISLYGNSSRMDLKIASKIDIVA